jgi:hypothetical protein
MTQDSRLTPFTNALVLLLEHKGKYRWLGFLTKPQSIRTTVYILKGTMKPAAEEGKGKLGDSMGIASQPDRGISDRPAVVTELTPNDVLFGRGAPNIFYIGNLRFRDIVSQRKSDFMGTGRHHVKQEIAQQVFRQIEQSNGRFLRKIKTKDEARKLGHPEGTAGWVVVDKEAAMRKVKQALREEETKQPVESKDPDPNPGLPVELRKSEPVVSSPPDDTSAIDTQAPSMAFDRASISRMVDQINRNQASHIQERGREELSSLQQDQAMQYSALLAMYQQPPSANDLSRAPALSSIDLQLFSQRQGLPNTSMFSPLSPGTLALDIARSSEGRQQAAIRDVIRQQQERDTMRALLVRHQLLAGSSAPATGLQQTGDFACLSSQGATERRRREKPLSASPLLMHALPPPPVVSPTIATNWVSNHSSSAARPFLDVHSAESNKKQRRD